MKDSSLLSSRKICEKMHFQAIHSESSDAFSDQSPTSAGVPAGAPPVAPPVQPLVEQNKSQTEMQFVNEEDAEALGAAAPPPPTTEEARALSAMASKTDSPSRRKGVLGRGCPAPLCGRAALPVTALPLHVQSTEA